MIVKNEEEILERSLSSIAPLVDEMIITDTGSIDATIDIAKKFTKHVKHFEWCDDFSAARNFCSSFVTTQYILRWDADFILKEGHIAKLLELKDRDLLNADRVYLRWNVDHGDDGTPIKYMQNYFIYRTDMFTWKYPVHNLLTPVVPHQKIKNLIRMDIEVDHHKDRKKKEYRYSQTAKLVKEVLQKEPNNPRYLMNYSEGLMFDGNYIEAIGYLYRYLEYEDNSEKQDVVERKASAIDKLVYALIKAGRLREAEKQLSHLPSAVFSHPLVQLSRADILSITSPTDAIPVFRNYLHHPVTPENNGNVYDHERFYVHPRLILGTLLSERNIPEALIYINDALRATRVGETKDKIIHLLENLGEQI
ncbi:glycosyltransferase [Candidatus Dojkabacteria bacterium]|uniref:Glycosyltransferase n=1 Tax=Candidatus Dojkabacteria bacterium TaxID=2099670 RepID=A0A955KWC9_9BACT|nr:glycosyltransferase [Candidatus Dojkabacteria bacterium]